MSVPTVDVFEQPDLVDLLGNEPELLAFADAIAQTQSRRRPGLRHSPRRVVVLAASLAAIAIPTAAFGGQIGRLIGSLAQREAARDALPDTAVMAVFERPPTAADALPPAAAAVVKQFATAPVQAALNPGLGDLSDSRRALVDAGQAHASLYLVPTNKGSLCMVWAPDIGGGCTQGFMPGVDVILLRGSLNGLSHVWGIFRDNVKSVSAVVDSQERPVKLSDSAFFYEGATLPSKLVLGLTDGTTETVPVAAMPTLK